MNLLNESQHYIDSTFPVSQLRRLHLPTYPYHFQNNSFYLGSFKRGLTPYFPLIYSLTLSLSLIVKDSVTSILLHGTIKIT